MPSAAPQPSSFDFLSHCLRSGGGELKMYYKGPFDSLILSNLSKSLRARFPARPGAKLFAVFIELAQNVSLYSVETNSLRLSEEDASEVETGVGAVVVQELGQAGYRLSAGNVVDGGQARFLTDHCAVLAQCDHQALRELKRQARSAPREVGQQGGRIGLIQVALKAKGAIRAESFPLPGERFFFSVSVDISA